MGGLNRTALAALLTGLALALPLGAWWVSGSREATRDASEEALRLARRLGERLETLRQTEDRRPWQHYQNLYHEPKGAYEGQSVVPSPLAQGPEDPLVRAHFQVEAGGALTLPTLNTQIDELNRDNEVQWRGIQTDLAPLAAQCAPGVSSQKDQGPAQAQVLDEDSWSQNAKANAIWRDLKSSSRKGQAQDMENKQG